MIEQGADDFGGMVTSIPSPGPALSDPTGATPLADAALWVQHALLGTTATSVAVIAIAATGFLALTGRIDLRRGATTVVGCFILFAAPAMAAALIDLWSVRAPPARSVPGPGLDPAIPPAPPPPPSVYDPYAGASVGRR